MTLTQTYSYKAMHKCLVKEVRRRERIYPELVRTKKMDLEYANDQIRIMREIRNLFWVMAQREAA